MLKLVVLGTASGVGKSTVVSILCYLFRKAGLKVAPFKGQNMSLNSTSTWYGEEIAYIQYMQCQLSDFTPCAYVNPILLKPVQERLSEVIVLGRARWLTSGRDYMDKFRKVLWEVAETSLKVLSKICDVVIVEGAGAAYEPNFAQWDFVNIMPLTYRDAKCIIAADIYRGGAFTSLLGTYLSLPEKFRERVVGFLINRFCGDETLLENAVRWLEDKTGKKVLGVLPLHPDLDIFPEDSLDLPTLEHVENASVDIAIVYYPGMSNFGEFQLLKLNPEVSVRVVRKASELGSPDLIILPGTRNVFKALAYLRKTGLDRAILRHVGSTPVLGICGGMQILSLKIIDNTGFESGTCQECDGLGLVPAVFHYLQEKIIARVEVTLDSKLQLIGFEIHRGVPKFLHEQPLMYITRRNHTECTIPEGFQDEKRQVYATMIHEVVAWPRFLNLILRHVNRKLGDVSPWSLLEERVERAVQIFKRHVDVDYLLDVTLG